MSKHTKKALNILITLLFLSAICITPVSATPAKIVTDTPTNEVTIDNFHTKIANFALSNKWSEKTLYPFYKYCALDEKCLIDFVKRD